MEIRKAVVATLGSASLVISSTALSQDRDASPVEATEDIGNLNPISTAAWIFGLLVIAAIAIVIIDDEDEEEPASP